MQSNNQLNQSDMSTKISNSTQNIMRQSLQKYIKNVTDAHRQHRIFSVHSSKMPAKNELKSRGWLEKLLPGCHPRTQKCSLHNLLRKAKPGNKYELVLISKLINNFPIHFIWVPSNLYAQLSYDRMAFRNRISRGSYLNYSTKVGLVGCAEQEHWYKTEGICEMNHPRFYRMGGAQEERKEFIDDFRHTQCRSLVQFIIDKVENPSETIDKDFGTVLPKVLKFALKILRLQLNEFDHNSLDNDENSCITVDSWDKFMCDSSKIINKMAKFKADISVILNYTTIGSRLLKRLKQKQPDYQWDGCRNIWILKPGYRSCGYGVIVRNNLQDILNFTKQQNDMHYIAQKYVERPLLIYNTKFDIRQHILLTISDTLLRIYMYKDCYFKFATQEFTLENFSERVHVTNHTVQKPYQQCVQNPKLPTSLMWSLDQFKVYLKRRLISPDIWEKKIFPAFGRNVVAVIMSGLPETDFVGNTFELIGCDFMLDQHYNPILLEVNCTPDLSASTSVTERLCAMLQKDVIKVLVDRPNNPRAPIGKFKLIHELEHKIKRDFKPNPDISISGKSLNTLSKSPSVKGSGIKKRSRITFN